MTAARRIELLADAEVGDIVRLDAGLVRVGQLLARDRFCRLVEPDGDGYRDVSEPLFIATRTRVLEVLRGQAHYEARPHGREVDPLQRRP